LCQIKACRGGLSEAMVDKQDTRDPPATSKYSCRVPVFEMPQNSIVLFATVEGKYWWFFALKIYCHLTFIGTVSWRHQTEGSWLMKPLCEVLNNAEHDKEILELITRTQRLVCEQPPKEEKKTGQTPEVYYNSHVQLRIQQNNWCVKTVWNYFRIFIFTIFTLNSGTITEDTVRIDAVPPKLDDCLNEFYKWDKFSKGYSTIIKTSPSFDESNLKKAIEENLEIVTEVREVNESNPNADSVINKAIQNGNHHTLTFALVF
jgi:hypothetical protein